MDILVKQAEAKDQATDALIIGCFQEGELENTTQTIDEALNGAITELLEGGDLTGKPNQLAVLYPRGALPARRVLLTGLGEKDALTLDALRQAVGAAAVRARDLGARHVASAVLGGRAQDLDLESQVQAIVEGVVLALYRYPAERLEPAEAEAGEIESLTILVHHADSLSAAQSGASWGENIAAGVTLTRTLVNHPSNIATPTFLGETAKAIAAEHDLKCWVHDRAWAQEQGMGSFLAVAQGAGEPPSFIVLEHDPGLDDVDTLVLVGKGITFDSGGISIKPSQRMHLMKGDMGGGGAVLGAMKVIGAAKLPLRVIGLVPATDNMPDANAYKPGDVVRAMNGKTIEVRNTDAEGRMILADALCYAATYNPVAVVDLATLTGACVVALGAGMAAGCFSNDDALRDQLLEASSTSSERIWPMPLFKEYSKALKSDVADLVHHGDRMGGVGTSAAFLKAFTGYPWAHLDIAGMAFSDAKPPNSYTPKGGTGFGVRLLVEFIRNWNQ